MNCRELSEFLMAYLDGELPAGARDEFEFHVRGCEACFDYLDSYRATIALTRAACAEEAPAPDDAPEALVQAILAARRRLPPSAT